MSERKKAQKADFWKRIAQAEVALQRELGAEFERHETVVRKILVKMRADGRWGNQKGSR